MPEAEGGQRPWPPRVLVEAAGQAHDRRKVQAHPVHGDPTLLGGRHGRANEGSEPGQVLDWTERREREFVRRVGREEKEQRPQRPPVHDRVHDCRVR